LSTAIRILHLGSPNGLYGAERWILALVRHLDPGEAESHVGVICDEPGLDPPLLREAAALGLPILAIDAPGRFNRASVRKLRAYIRANDIQILHTHFYKTDIIGLLAVRGTNCRIVTTPHGWSTQAGMALRAYEAIDRLVFRFFDAVVPLSPNLVEELRPKVGSRLRYIQNGVDISEVDAVTDPAPESLDWRNDGQFVVGYIGQLISRKGIGTLLEAFARLGQDSVRLVLVGEGPQRAEFEALADALGIRPRVSFLGYRQDRLALLRGFDVFALPSRLEGIPRCLMEAMAAGVPIVASDIPGCRDLVESGATGLLHQPDDVEGLSAALKDLQNPVLRRRLAMAARIKVEREFSASAMATSYSRLYRDLTR
jgi:glycosyltransferase involved in cell wall biosynthesis